MKSVLIKIAEQPQGNVVGTGKHCSGVQTNQLLSGKIRIWDVVVGVKHKIGIRLDVLLGKCLFVPGKTTRTGCGLGINHTRNTRMPMVKQILGCPITAQLIVEIHLVTNKIVYGAVNHYERNG